MTKERADIREPLFIEIEQVREALDTFESHYKDGTTGSWILKFCDLCLAVKNMKDVMKAKGFDIDEGMMKEYSEEYGSKDYKKTRKVLDI
jgi:hypothetical protein